MLSRPFQKIKCNSQGELLQ